MEKLPSLLCHYYEARIGPFVNLSDLPIEEAERILDCIRRRGTTFASRRAENYLQVRRQLEDHIRAAFIAKGGQPRRARPHYMVLGRCPWLLDWYEQGCEIRIALDRFRPNTLSFTYGDTFPAMRRLDGKPYRQQVYTLAELPELVSSYGLPQDWNAGGSLGPDRYIEAQVWDETGHFYPAAERPFIRPAGAGPAQEP
jgi:hypothetical protein